MQEKLPIVLTFDKNFAHVAYVAMQSVINTATPDQKHHFYVLHENLPIFIQEIGKALFNTANASITFLDVSSEMSKVRISRHTDSPRASFYRLLIPKIFKNDAQVLYLNCNLVVVKDLYRILNDAKIEAPLAAIRDPFPKDKKDPLWFADEIPHFNAGVLLFRPQLISNEHYQMCLKLCARNFERPAQSILNFVFHDEIAFLPDCWNFITGEAEIALRHTLPDREKERSYARILNFVGNKLCEQPNLANAERFWEIERALQKRLAMIGKTLIEKYLPMP